MPGCCTYTSACICPPGGATALGGARWQRIRRGLAVRANLGCTIYSCNYYLLGLLHSCTGVLDFTFTTAFRIYPSQWFFLNLLDSFTIFPASRQTSCRNKVFERGSPESFNCHGIITSSLFLMLGAKRPPPHHRRPIIAFFAVDTLLYAVTLTSDLGKFAVYRLWREELYQIKRNRAIRGGVTAISLFDLMTLNACIRVALGSWIIFTFTKFQHRQLSRVAHPCLNYSVF